MRPLRLRTRLALVFASGFAILLGLEALGLYLFLAREYRRDFDRSLIDAGQSTRALFAEDRSEFGTTALTAAHIISELAYGDRTLVAFDSAGHFLTASVRIPGEPYFNDVPATGPHDRPVTTALRDGEARLIRVPLEGGVEVVIAMNTMPLEQRLVHITEALLFVLPLILLLGGLVGAWASRLILRPIVLVAESAEQIGSEVAHGAVRFARLEPRPGDDEISTLTQAFNHLVDRLSSALARERGVAEQQRRFLADAAHELRTPVAILRSEAEVTLRGNGDVTNYRQAMERVASEANELSMLVSDLLLIARGDAFAIVPSRQKVYLDDLVNDVAARTRHLPAAAGRDIARPEFEAAPVSGDPVLLERALLVLVHNALVHAPGATVEVSTGIRTEGDRRWSWVRVRDYGPGVPTQDRERIFERFARLNTGVAGSGLGLAIARAIAEAHGGDLKLEDAYPGAAFILRIPAA
ncbi:MAG TPA: HAMP domain-containing sensor histidine kinase [Gemmatimonadales bacterium]|nr:HAMP domain-containing sensor histidine kinase [Gemmatimonadales bacterium]